MLFQSYPMTNFGNPKRCFNASYFNEHDWLEYSIQNDSLHYSLCRNFGAKDNEGTFSKTGFRNWKKVCIITDYNNFIFKTFNI